MHNNLWKSNKLENCGHVLCQRIYACNRGHNCRRAKKGKQMLKTTDWLTFFHYWRDEGTTQLSSFTKHCLCVHVYVKYRYIFISIMEIYANAIRINWINRPGMQKASEETYNRKNVMNDVNKRWISADLLHLLPLHTPDCFKNGETISKFTNDLQMNFL